MTDAISEGSSREWWSPETFKSLGLPTVLCCAFMWIGKGEIDKASARYDKLSDIMTTSTVRALESVAASINNSTEAVRQGSVCINNNTEALKAIAESMDDRKHGTASIPPVPKDGI